MSHDLQLPPGDRDDLPVQKPKESGAEYLRKLIVQAGGDDPRAPQHAPKPWRRWVGERSSEQRIDAIFDKREPGSDDE